MIYKQILGSSALWKCPLNILVRPMSSAAIQMSYISFETANTNNALTPIIIMHGLFGSKTNWRGIGRALEQKTKRKIFAVDARNHGDSPHTSDHTSELMSKDIVAFMQANGIAKANVIGHSMGGRAMMYFCLKYPQLVEKVIIADVSPISMPRDVAHMDNIMLAMKNINVSSDLSLAAARPVVQQQLKDVVGDVGTVDFIMTNLRKRDTGTFYWACNVDALRKVVQFSNYTEILKAMPAFNGPIIFICGKHSNFVKRDELPEIKSIFPKTEMFWLNTGHLVHFEEPAEFLRIITEFLK